jgi:hypothetical protein
MVVPCDRRLLRTGQQPRFGHRLDALQVGGKSPGFAPALMRQRGQSPLGASSGISVPHCWQDFMGKLASPVTEESPGKGYGLSFVCAFLPARRRNTARKPGGVASACPGFHPQATSTTAEVHQIRNPLVCGPVLRLAEASREGPWNPQFFPHEMARSPRAAGTTHGTVARNSNLLPPSPNPVRATDSQQRHPKEYCARLRNHENQRLAVCRKDCVHLIDV